MENEALLKALGYETVANATGASRSAVANWRVRGIPWRHRLTVSQLAEKNGLPLSDSYWNV